MAVDAFVGTRCTRSRNRCAFALIRHRLIAVFAYALRILATRNPVREQTRRGIGAINAAAFGKVLARQRRILIDARLESCTIRREFAFDLTIVELDECEAQKETIKGQALGFAAYA